MKSVWIGIIVFVILAALFGVGIYNGLISKDENVNQAWAQVDTVLQRRYDLIPNLVNTVKGYAKHEKDVFENIARLRSQWGEAKTQETRAEAAGKMESALARLLLVVENYPTLKADKNFMALQDELAGTENRIAVERRRYNDAVRDYNASVRRFPSNLFARMMGLPKNRTYFEAAQEAKQAPKVEF